ncbi:hypothetical protein IVA80_15210 [Bradyrhizobium sp. 139]|uniref:hypothetical protein n=1 Tax=Bradyrhizobium sp. 139 TaxID=2782616 RepID=UPI001FFA2DF8|nr:hypothetical protein [Bradyrhizobium sp. 139]MCK1742172.1 hypothetical protein [Bradyrhizobium sp. 139]
MAPKYPSIPDPTNDPNSLRDTVLSLKQAVELLTGQRGDDSTTAVTADASVGTLGTQAPQMDGAAAVGASTNWAREDHVHPSDTSRLSTAGNQTVTGGFKVTPFSNGAMGTGTFTFDPTKGNYQSATNSGAVAILAPTSDCAIDVLITNSATAGSLTFSGYTVGASTGDALTTTNGHKFLVSIRRIGGVSTYIIKALQ